MGEFWTLEGIDGAGKSHLLTQLADRHPNATLVRKDARPPSSSPWAEERLTTMHHLTWSYDHAEPVWTYPSRYWVHTLAAWYELFHVTHVAPAVTQGRTVVVDGWHFKHLARMTLSGDAALISLAERVFSALPQPDRVIWLPTSTAVAAQRRSGNAKPSEHGAFLTNQATTSPGSFADYQSRTARLMADLLHEHRAPVRTLAADDPTAELVDLLSEEPRP
ncbi:AAA family ATPase [Nocardiopsis sp. HNM0947]|uniref:AAA family ATPase n=1 Tax=Nocardiopsis coralli TaxID=2772213 RepID=A0ABR9P065_9ACTN|nr:AAA family ATPase [Nocardiopsis coralli]MBE2997208.1 AAA family ATPase [Nocardiopsis coralli]